MHDYEYLMGMASGAETAIGHTDIGHTHVERLRAMADKLRRFENKSSGGQHVAWLRYDNHNGQRPTTVHLCDSDAPGAFKVYRALAPEAACRNCGATERPDQCSGGPWCAYPPPKPGGSE